jgi:hypothetical protein
VKDLLKQPENTLPELDTSLSQRRAGEEWLIGIGAMPQITAEQLLLFAYSVPGVLGSTTVNAKLPQGEEDKSVVPSFTYLIDLEVSVEIPRKEARMYRLAMWGLCRGTVLGKIIYLIAVKLGAPIQKILTSVDSKKAEVLDNVLISAQNYLPPRYEVFAETRIFKVKVTTRARSKKKGKKGKVLELPKFPGLDSVAVIPQPDPSARVDLV